MKRKIGLALGGGGARGIAHLGVYMRLMELGVPIHCVAGTSIGAIAGAFIAAGTVDKALAWCAGAGLPPRGASGRDRSAGGGRRRPCRLQILSRCSMSEWCLCRNPSVFGFLPFGMTLQA